MTSNEFNDAVRDIVRQCQQRNQVFAWGHHCKHGPQPFEEQDPVDTVEEALEEVYDLINYSVMLALKFKKLQRNIA